MDWQIFGHKRQIKILSQVLKKKTVSHAYLFVGPKFVGKTTIARKFAQALLCESQNACGECKQCKMVNQDTNPDLFTIGSNREELTVDAIRQFCYKISLKSFSAKYKIAIIENAQALKDSAANAILKTLEEPSLNTVIILISSNLQSILQTIRSRSQVISFGYVEQDEYSGVSSSDLERKDLNSILRVSQGRPGLYKKLLHDEPLIQKFLNFIQVGSELISADLITRHLAVQKILDLESDDLEWFLETLIYQTRKELYQKYTPSSAYNASILDKTYRYILEKSNSKLILTGLALGLK
jgi:DNA polymerase-3 subunit delta'